jgi:hypothetical protein
MGANRGPIRLVAGQRKTDIATECYRVSLNNATPSRLGGAMTAQIGN